MFLSLHAHARKMWDLHGWLPVDCRSIVKSDKRFDDLFSRFKMRNENSKIICESFNVA
jgi:hypothetical protein